MTTERVVRSDRDRRTPADRRVSKPRVHVPERRLGFDRRTDPSPERARSLAWIRRISESNPKAAALMISIVALNVADILFTFGAIEDGRRELNPVVAALLDGGPGLAAFIKVGVSVVLAALGWRFRRFRRVIETALIVVALMSFVVLYHVLSFAFA